MKTAVIMQRQNMNGLSIRQNSKNQFFNATDLVEAYNLKTGDLKRIQNYLDNEATKRFMVALAQAENDNNSKESNLNNGLIETKRGKYGGTWMHPYLFIDLAMWLSPEFKVTVIRWVYDNLIKLRNEAGDSFKDVNEALFDKYPSLPPFGYANEAKMINKLVFGNPNAGQRNLATEVQLSMLKSLQKADIKLIQSGLDYYERYEKLKELKQFI
jgi:hypothetical protein